MQNGYGAMQQSSPWQQQQQQMYDPYGPPVCDCVLPLLILLQYDSSWLGEIDNARLEPQVQHSDMVMREMHSGPNQTLLLEVQVGIEQLMSQPEEAEVWTEAIITRLTQPRTASIEVQTLVNTMIFETAAAQPQSAYMLAVLLNSMCAHAQLAESFLMHCVLPYCRTEHERRAELYYQDIDRLRAFAQFVAELYLRLHTVRRQTSLSHSHICSASAMRASPSCATPCASRSTRCCRTPTRSKTCCAPRALSRPSAAPCARTTRTRSTT